MNGKWIGIAIVIFMVSSCGRYSKENTDKKTVEAGRFDYDLDFLNQWDQNLIVLERDKAKVLISPKYQAKVFTSTASGNKGKSLGWINYGAFGKEDPHMHAYGGENRFWLGPEGNRFSLFFQPKTKMVFDNWKTPPPIDREPWAVTIRTDTSATLMKKMSLLNYVGYQFEIDAIRTITILTRREIGALLHVDIGKLAVVGFRTENQITNAGEQAWTDKTGAPCIWILDMFPPSEETTVVIPYREEAEGEVATTDYFGQIPDDRIAFDNGLLYFRTDGKSRGKLGLSPKRATNIAGSYDAANKIVTLTLFEVHPGAVYLNQQWDLESNPFQGDAINAYNDGPLEDGSQMGPFYEIESVSPAAFLQPGETVSHRHSVFHFTGDEKELNQITEALFGVGLQGIRESL